MTTTVTAVIPTLGRPSLQRAVRSVLDQTRPVSEIIVVADGEAVPALPDDDRITLLHNSVRAGPSRCRQVGIDAARNGVIALLDDDDEWCDTKLERQLDVVDSQIDPNWVASSRFAVHGPRDRQRIWPRRLIERQQSLPEYLFLFNGVRAGAADLQSSTLCFPTEMARKVRWDFDPDAVNDEATWLIRVERAFPELRVIQLPDVLSYYNVSNPSVSRDPTDRTADYIDWGREYLRTASPRVRGDYLCTYPVSAAVSARSLRGVRTAMLAAFRYGRPGPLAVGYAVANGVRIALRATEFVVQR